MIEKNNQGIYQHSPGLQVPAVVTHTLNFFLPVNLPKHCTPLSQPAYLYQISSPSNHNSLPAKTRSTVPTLSPLCHSYRHPIPAPSQTFLSPTAPPPPLVFILPSTSQKISRSNMKPAYYALWFQPSLVQIKSTWAEITDHHKQDFTLLATTSILQS